MEKGGSLPGPWLQAVSPRQGALGTRGKAFPQAAGEARGSGNHGNWQGPPAGLRQEAAQVKSCCSEVCFTGGRVGGSPLSGQRVCKLKPSGERGGGRAPAVL